MKKPKHISEKPNKSNPNLEQGTVSAVNNTYGFYSENGDSQAVPDFEGTLKNAVKEAQKLADERSSTVLVIRVGLGVKAKVEKVVKPITAQADTEKEKTMAEENSTNNSDGLEFVPTAGTGDALPDPDPNEFVPPTPKVDPLVAASQEAVAEPAVTTPTTNPNVLGQTGKVEKAKKTRDANSTAAERTRKWREAKRAAALAAGTVFKG